MQDYNKFITEVTTLDIRVKAVCVNSFTGKIEPRANPDNWPDESGLPQPYRIEKVIDLSHYNQQEGGYEGLLNQLQQLAINDLLMMTAEQRQNQLIRLRELYDKFGRLICEYVQVYKLSEEAQLRPGDIQISSIYSYFSIPDRPEPNTPLNTRFIEDLGEAITEKAGIVIDTINQVKKLNLSTESVKQKGSKNLALPPEYKSFTDLFIDPKNIAPCVQALRDYDIDKPVLNEGLNWIGGPKSKGVIVGWIARMEHMNPPKIHKLTNRKELVKLLNSYFSNLKMGEYASVFDSKIVDNNMKDRFTALLPR